MKPYPSVFHACTSKLRPAIGFFEPNQLDEVSKRIPPISQPWRNLAADRSQVLAARSEVRPSDRHRCDVGRPYPRKYSFARRFLFFLFPDPGALLYILKYSVIFSDVSICCSNMRSLQHPAKHSFRCGSLCAA